MLKKWILKLVGVDGPFNGWKTIAGILLYFLPVLFPDAAPEHIEQFIQILGQIIMAIGALHKAWKNLNRGGKNLIVFALVCVLPQLAYAKPVEVDCHEADLAVETGAYADGDLVGEKTQITDGDDSKTTAGFIKQVFVYDKDAENADLVLYFACADLDDGTYTDNSTLTIDDDDLEDICCKVEIEAADYRSITGNSIAQKAADCAYRIDAGTSLYVVAEADGSTPTYTAITDLSVKVCMLEDGNR